MKYKILKVQNISKSCIICGIENNLGLKTRFFEIKTNDKNVLVGKPNVKNEHQSYPNRMHGGVISALLDETIGRAIQIEEPDTWGVTAELVTKYKKPVPLNEEILVLGYITKNVSRLFEGEGKIILASTGEVLAEASARYIKQKAEVIANNEFMSSEWFEDLKEHPNEIEILNV